MKLVTRATPRADAPTDIGQPAVSGFVCDDDPSPAGTSDSASGLGAAAATANAGQGSAGGDRHRDYDWTRDTGPVGSALRGFQEIALLKALKNARGRDRARIRREYFTASTKGGAKFFVHKVALMARGNRMPAVRRARPGILSLFRLPPARQWVADPVGRYRGR